MTPATAEAAVSQNPKADRRSRTPVRAAAVAGVQGEAQGLGGEQAGQPAEEPRRRHGTGERQGRERADGDVHPGEERLPLEQTLEQLDARAQPRLVAAARDAPGVRGNIRHPGPPRLGEGPTLDRDDPSPLSPAQPT